MNIVYSTLVPREFEEVVTTVVVEKQPQPEHSPYALMGYVRYEGSGEEDYSGELVLLVLHEGEHKSVKCSLEFFRPQKGSSSPSPDFRRFQIGDYGHTILFGEYEAALNAIIDPNRK